MSEVIKFHDSVALSRVKTLPVPAKNDAAPEADGELDLLLRRIASLEGDLSQRDATIKRLERGVEEALARGRSEGRVLGLAEADRREDERLQLLERGLERAQDELEASLGSLERLAALLVRDCLDILFGNPDRQEELLAGLIAGQMAKIEKAALLGIVVSQEDFTDAASLSSLAKRAGIAIARFSLDPELPPGACVMRLRLGNQEIGIGQQWGTLRRHLEELSLPEDET
jgi:hypothetical protein